MRKENSTRRERLQQIEELQTRLAETEDALRAIRGGEVDAIVVSGAEGEQVFTLQSAEQPYRALVETMNEGTVTLLPEGTIVYSNNCFAQIVRTPLEQVFGSSFARFLSSHQAPSFNSLLERSRNGGSKEELTLLASDGSLVPAQLSVRPFEEKQTGAYCLVVTDLTERREAERVRSFLAEIVDSSEDAIIGNTLEGTIVSWNRAAERLYGYQAQEVIGRSSALLLPPDHLDELAAILGKVKRGEKVEPYETEGVRKDSTRFDVSLTTSPVQDATGAITGASVIARDITQRKRAELELGRLNRALRAISWCNQIIARTQSEQEILESVCKCLVEVCGYRMAYVVYAEHNKAKTVRPVAHAGAEDGFLAEAGITWADDMHGQGPSGSAIRSGQPAVIRSTAADANFTPWREEALKRGYASAIGLPLRAGPQLLGALTVYAAEPDAFDGAEVKLLSELADDLGFGTDTIRTRMERKRAQEALEKRTQELTDSQKALEQKVQELARSNADLEQFAYVASHDLQEPLRTVASFAQLMKRRFEGKLDANADDYIHFMVDGATRMQGLVHDLLAYSRVGRHSNEFVPADLTAVFDQAIANLQMALTESAAVVTHGPLPTVKCDGAQLIQVFQNLIGNSLKFCNSKGPRVHVAAQQQASQWVFSVKDNGIGIDPQYAQRIFEVFQRLHTRSEYPGSGIGLAIAKKIVEQHGGRIWVESKLHQGATFFFTLPA